MTMLQDLHRLPEEERIALIGHYVLEHRLSVAVLVDDETDKVERYISKILALSPDLLVEQLKGPVAKVVTLRVSLRTEGAS